MWQELIVAACVLSALVFVTRRYWSKSSSGCGTGACGGCGSAGQCSSTAKK